MIKIPFLFLGLLGEDVAVVSVLPLDFSRPGKRETLFGTGIGLKFCHCFVVFNNNYNLPQHCGLFFLYGGYHDVHAFALESWHVLGPAEFFQFHCKAEELLFALVFEHDRAAAEEDGGLHLHLGALLEELLSVLQFELEVMLVGVGAESYLLHDHFRGIRFHLLGLLALLIEIFLVVQNLAHRRVGLIADEDQIELQLVCYRKGFCKGIYSLLGNVLSNKAHLRGGYLLVDRRLVLIPLLCEMLVGLASFFEA